MRILLISGLVVCGLLGMAKPAPPVTLRPHVTADTPCPPDGCKLVDCGPCHTRW